MDTFILVLALFHLVSCQNGVDNMNTTTPVDSTTTTSPLQSQLDYFLKTAPSDACRKIMIESDACVKSAYFCCSLFHFVAH